MQRNFRLKNLSTDESIAIDKHSILVGRSPQCDIYIDSGLLSRHHASVLLIDEESVLIKDLESTNGTFVNSMRISRARRLQHGDVITIGDIKFLFIDSNSEINRAGEEDLLVGDHELEPDAELASNRTMIQSSAFKSLGLDPSVFNFSSEDLSLISMVNGDEIEAIDPTKTPAVMIVKSGRRKGGVIKLNLPAFSVRQWSVGRSQLCDVVLEDPTVSSEHAFISWSDGVWSIVDSGSTNGIKINGSQVEESHFQHDDVLSVGSIKLLFKVLHS